MIQRVYNLTDKDLPDNLLLVREVFLNEVLNSRKRGESLHQYFTRKGFKCFCKACSRKRELERNATLFEIGTSKAKPLHPQGPQSLLQ